MCAGDFVEVYSAQDQAASFDCVATCFFLDTAHNILQYMQIIRHILKVKSQRCLLRHVVLANAQISICKWCPFIAVLTTYGSVDLVLLGWQHITSFNTCKSFATYSRSDLHLQGVPNFQHSFYPVLLGWQRLSSWSTFRSYATMRKSLQHKHSCCCDTSMSLYLLLQTVLVHRMVLWKDRTCPVHASIYAHHELESAFNHWCYDSQDGGCWINLGPLLFHWADAHTYLPEEELSIELSLEEVEAAAKQLGFKTIKREMVSAAYMTNLRYVLLCCIGRLTLQLCFLLFPMLEKRPLQQMMVLHVKHTKVQALHHMCMVSC